MLLTSTDQSLSTRALPTRAVPTPGAVMVLFGATLSLENVSVGLLCTILNCPVPYAGATARPCRETVPCSINMLF